MPPNRKKERSAESAPSKTTGKQSASQSTETVPPPQLTRQKRLPDAVRQAVENGLSVVPVDESGKPHLVRLSAYFDKPASLALVEKWHAKYPTALWAFVTGREYLVLDFDTRHGGDERLRKLGLKAKVTTPGGWHVWVEAPDYEIRSGTSPEFPGMEVKGWHSLVRFCGERSEGKYVGHKNAPVYPLAELPLPLRTFIESLRRDEANSAPPFGTVWERPSDDWIQRTLAKAHERVVAKGRNDTGHWLAQQLWWNGVEPPEVRELLHEYQKNVRGSRSDPYRVTDVNATLRQVFKEERREPEASAGEDDDELRREVAAMLNKSDIPEDYVAEGMTDEELRKRPKLKSLIPGWVPQVGVIGFWGVPGAGKTYALISMAIAVRRGHRWQHPTERVTRKGGVAFWEGEVPEQLISRQDAIEKWPLVNTELSPQKTWGETPPLDEVDGVCAFVRTVEEFKEKLVAQGDELALIVVDPLPNFILGDENGDGKVRAVRALCWIAERFQCAVAVGDQSNAAGQRARGHDVYRQRVFTYARVERVDSDLIALVQEKNKFGREIAIELWMTPVVLGHDDKGRSIEDAVLEYDPGGPIDSWEYERLKAERIESAKRRKRQQVASAGFREMESWIIEAFKYQKNTTGEPAFTSVSALVTRVQVTHSGASDSSIRRTVNGLVAAKRIDKGEAGRNNQKGVVWIGED